MSIFIRDNVYYVDVCVKDKRQKMSTGLIVKNGDPKKDRENKEKAEHIALQKKAEFLRRNVNGEKIHDWLIGQRRQLQRWKVFIPKHFIWSDINLHFLQDFVKGLEKHGKYTLKTNPDGSKTGCYEDYSPSTIHSYLDEITSMAKKAARRGHCDPPDWERKDIYNKPRVAKNKKIVYSESELTNLLNTEMTFKNEILGEVWDTISAWKFALNTGLRFVDIHSLKWSDILETEVYKKQMKTSRFVRIPLNEYAQSILNEMRRIRPNAQYHDKVFNLPEYNSTTEHLEKWRKKSGIITKFTWHGARRTFATLLHLSGVDIYTISGLLGHSDVRITQRYVELRDSVKIAATYSLGTMVSRLQSSEFVHRRY
jgi:integrase